MYRRATVPCPDGLSILWRTSLVIYSTVLAADAGGSWFKNNMFKGPAPLFQLRNAFSSGQIGLWHHHRVGWKECWCAFISVETVGEKKGGQENEMKNRFFYFSSREAWRSRHMRRNIRNRCHIARPTADSGQLLQPAAVQLPQLWREVTLLHRACETLPCLVRISTSMRVDSSSAGEGVCDPSVLWLKTRHTANLTGQRLWGLETSAFVAFVMSATGSCG